MASDHQLLEDGSTYDYGSELNTSRTDELAAVSALARGAGELMIIRTLQRFIKPLLLPLLTPLIHQIVEEKIGLANRNPTNEATTSVPKRRLKLQFRNRISLPVFTGKRLLGENGTTIEIALVDACTDQIMNTGIESTAKLEIVGFQVVGDNNSWTYEDFQEMVMSQKKGKRILQGDTCLQLKDGVCFVSKISFTHSSENTKNGFYRLMAGVVDAKLMNRVEVAKTEAFLMKDGRTAYSEKHTYPRLSDKVCHLQKISYKGRRHRCLKDAGVITVKNLLTLFYKDPKRLQDILKVSASSNTWNDIVNNAQASNGMFLYLDPSNDGKTGVVLNAKLQLKGLIAEPHKYVPVHHLSAKQKVENREVVKFASEHFDMLPFYEDETCLEEYLISCTSFTSLPPSLNQSLETSNMIDKTPQDLDKSNSYVGQLMTYAPIVTSEYEPTVSFDNEMTCSMNYNQEDMSILENSTEHYANYPTDPGTSFQAVESRVHTCEHMSNSIVSGHCMDCLINGPDFIEKISQFLNHDFMNSDSVSICAIERARTRWIKVSKLLRRNSVRERIGIPKGIQALKKQRCC